MIFSRFRRVTTKSYYSPEIDALRFLAIMPVFFNHMGTQILRNFEYSSEDLSSSFFYFIRVFSPIGVPLFFCISGYILSMPFVNEDRLDYRKYLLRRISRLEPPYFLCMILFFLGHVLFFDAPIGELIWHLIASLTYTHNIVYGEWSVLNSVAWTLEVEVQFYLLAPFIVIALGALNESARFAVIFMALIFFVLVEVYFFDVLASLNLSRSLLTKFHYFLLGIFLCFFNRKNNILESEKKYIWDLIALLCIPMSQMGSLFHVVPLADKLFFLFSLYLLFVAAFQGRITNKLARNPCVYLIGGMCYSIYLLHYPIFHISVKLFSNVFQSGNFSNDFLFQAMTSGVLTLVICVAFYVLVERPCMYPYWYRTVSALIISKYNKMRSVDGVG